HQPGVGVAGQAPGALARAVIMGRWLAGEVLQGAAVTIEGRLGRSAIEEALTEWVQEVGRQRANDEATSLLDRWFGGSLAPLVAQFGGERPLRPDEVEALQALLQAQAGPSADTAENSSTSPARTPRRRAP
ncbi:MAG: hypothetical protein ACOVN9_14890, partial [Inhella sp.]